MPAKILGLTFSNADPSDNLVNTATNPIMANETCKYLTLTGNLYCIGYRWKKFQQDKAMKLLLGELLLFEKIIK